VTDNTTSSSKSVSILSVLSLSFVDSALARARCAKTRYIKK